MISRLLSSLSRISIGNVPGTVRTFTTNTFPLCFQVTQSLWGEPLKKKKKIDPAIIRHRFERRKRRLEKEIRRLEKVAKTPKPVLECEVPKEIYMEKNLRARKSSKKSPELEEERLLLHKEWSHFNLLQYREDLRIFENIQFSQEKALDALREESEELYQAAIQLDSENLPYKASGPTITPPIANFDSPDGDYFDITKKYEGE